MRLAPFALILMFTAIVSARCAFADVQVGRAAPGLVVQELNGQTFDLASLRGKVVIINFWATWCTPCRSEMPAFSRFYRQYHARGVEMIGLSVDRSHERSDVAQVMPSLGYPVAMLDDAQTDGFGDPDSIPETFIVDRAGVVRAWFTPDKITVTDKVLADSVVPLLATGTAAGRQTVPSVSATH